MIALASSDNRIDILLPTKYMKNQATVTTLYDTNLGQTSQLNSNDYYCNIVSGLTAKSGLNLGCRLYFGGDVPNR
jgi:hypothetical protein